MNDGNVLISVDADTREVVKTLSDLKSKVKQIFKGADSTDLRNSLTGVQAEIKKLEADARKAENALNAIMSGEKPPASITSMRKELAQTEKELDKMSKGYDKMLAEVEQYSSYAGINPKYVPQAQKYEEALAALERYEREWENLEAKADNLRTTLSSLEQNPQLTPEAQRYSETIKTSTERIEQLKEKQAELSHQIEVTGKVGGITNSSLVQGLDRVGNRLLRLAKRVFFFSLFTKMLRGLRSALGNVIKSDQVFAASLAQIKGNLATAFGAIWSSVLPALRVLIQWLAKATLYIAQFISWLTGKKFNQAQAAVQGISQGTADIGTAAKNATKQLNRMLLPFDEMNVLSSQDGGGGGGGGAAGAGGGTPSMLWPTEMDDLTAKFEKFKDLIALIGIAFGSWKLAKVLMPLLEMLGWGGSLLTLFGGILSIAYGIYEIIQAIRSIKKEGPNFANIMQLVSGSLLSVGGALALISGPIGWVIAAMGAVAGALSWLYKNCLTFRWVIDSIWKRLKEYKDKIAKAFKVGGFKNVFKELASVGWEIIKSILGGISVAKQVIHDWLQTHVFRPILDVFGNWIKDSPLVIKIKTAFTDTKAKLTKTWNKLTGNIKDKTANMRAFIGQKWSDLKTKWTSITSNIKDVVAEFKGTIKQKWSDLKSKWEDITNNIKDKTAEMKAKVVQKWADIKDKWYALTANVKDITANIVMKISTTLASVKQFVRDIIISINNKLNSVKWPSWVPGIGGKNILPYNPIPLPALASGAVIPANKQFLAILGDQKQGVNIETPLATMIEAFNTALQNAGMMGNADINVYLQGDARQLFKVVRTEAKNYTKSTGKAAFDL